MLAALFAAIAIRYTAYAAAMADASGYVSEAARWLGGAVFAAQPFSFWPAWRLDLTMPLGYRAAPFPGADVFVYPSGLPLTMAAAMALGGELAAYLVVPLLGAALVWATGDLAGRLAGPKARVLAAALMATSAIAMAMAVQPMSDVPAAAWWMLALALAPRRGRLAALAAGLAVTMAVLTRPNLAPLAIVPVALAAASTPAARISRAAIAGGAALIGPLLVLWMQAVLYGSPFASGYPGIEGLFSVAHAGKNARQFTAWYFAWHTPAILAAALAPLVFRRQARIAVQPAAGARAVVLALSAMAGGVCLAYAFYFPFEDWYFLRFLLPAIAPLYALAAAVLVRGCERVPAPGRTAAFAAVLVATAGVQAWQTRQREVFDIWKSSTLVPAAGRYLDAVLPRNAVVITFFHSGSVRYYTGRAILRPDLVDPDTVDATLARLEQGGYRPYLLLDEGLERPAFLARFPASARFGTLAWPPRARIGTYRRLLLYDLADAARAQRGERWPIDDVR